MAQQLFTSHYSRAVTIAHSRDIVSKTVKKCHQTTLITSRIQKRIR